MRMNGMRTMTVGFVLAALLMAESVLAKELVRTTLVVQNLVCGSCLNVVAEELQSLKGIAGMDADLPQKLVVVDHQPFVESERIAGIITDIGYPAEVFARDKITLPDNNDQKKTGTTPSSYASCCSSSAYYKAQQGSAATNQKTTGMLLKSTFSVANLYCGSCLSSIGEELVKLDGTVNMSADLAKGYIFVTHQDKLTARDIAAQITSIGYPARVVTTAKTVNFQENGANAAQSNFNRSRGGCGSGCNATASAWRQLYNKFFSTGK